MRIINQFGFTVSIWGSLHGKGEGDENSPHMGTPHNQKVFVTLRGLTYLTIICLL